jgi:hypothetical protein
LIETDRVGMDGRPTRRAVLNTKTEMVEFQQRYNVYSQVGLFMQWRTSSRVAWILYTVMTAEEFQDRMTGEAPF